MNIKIAQVETSLHKCYSIHYPVESAPIQNNFWPYTFLTYPGIKLYIQNVHQMLYLWRVYTWCKCFYSTASFSRTISCQEKFKEPHWTKWWTTRTELKTPTRRYFPRRKVFVLRLVSMSGSSVTLIPSTNLRVQERGYILP